MTSLKKAIFLSASDRHLALIVNFGAMAVVSRVLTPDEIGVSVIAMALVGIFLGIRDLAGGSFIIQRKVLSPADIKMVFTFQCLLSGGIIVVLLGCSPIIASYYNEARIFPYVAVVCLCLAIDLVPLHVISLLRRSLSFGGAAALNLTSTISASVGTVLFALLGFSFMSFAWGWLASSIVTSIVALSLQRQFWVFKFRLGDFSEIINFGRRNAAIGLSFRLFESAPFLTLGHVSSHEASAWLSRSGTISQVPEKLVLGAVLGLLLPTFSEHARQGSSLKESFLSSIKFITAVQWPAQTMLVLLAFPVVELAFGDQWDGIVPIVRLLALGYLFTFIFEVGYQVMMGAGKLGEFAPKVSGMLVVSAVILVLTAAAGGLYAVAMALAILMPLQAVIVARILKCHLGVEWTELVAATWRSAVVAIVTPAVPAVLFLHRGPTFDLSISAALMASLVAAATWLGALATVCHPLIGELRNLAPRRRPTVSLV